MILTLPVLDAIRRGEVTCAFRRWRRPSVRTGGTLMTAVGQLEIPRRRAGLGRRDLRGRRQARRSGVP